jgi:hypothetical protein
MLIGETQIVDEGCVVGVRVEMHDVQRRVEGPHDRIGDRMIPAQHQRQGLAIENRTRHRRDVVEGLLDVGGQDIGIAGIDDQPVGQLIFQILLGGFRVVEAPFAAADEA